MRGYRTIASVSAIATSLCVAVALPSTAAVDNHIQLVSVATPRSVQPIVAAMGAEYMTVPLDDTSWMPPSRFSPLAPADSRSTMYCTVPSAVE